MSVETTDPVFYALNARRRSLLRFDDDGKPPLTDLETAEAESIRAQMDVLEAADAIRRGEFAGQVERSQALAKLAANLYAALRAHDDVIGAPFDRLAERTAERPLAAHLDPEPIHGWFELSYAQYLTIPRSVLQSMPDEWQRRFVACLEELDEAVEWRPAKGRYRVALKDDKGRFVRDPLADYERGRRRVPLKERTP